MWVHISVQKQVLTDRRAPHQIPRLKGLEHCEYNQTGQRNQTDIETRNSPNFKVDWHWESLPEMDHKKADLSLERLSWMVFPASLPEGCQGGAHRTKTEPRLPLGAWSAHQR